MHPILYELARAKAIREIYENICKDLGKPSFWDPTKSKELDIADYAVQWKQWNSALADHDVGGYDNERAVIFKNRFTDFYTRLQKGEITNENNSLENANTQVETKFGLAFGIEDSVQINKNIVSKVKSAFKRPI